MKSPTRRQQDALTLLRAYTEATKARAPGDFVYGKGGVKTTIQSVDGDIATLATGEKVHISRLRSV
jgi:preprotein translocase subunit YajC